MAITTFTSGQILTAAQMNAVQSNDFNQTVNTSTASYVLVASDKGTRRVMNSGSATTITVNTSLFSASDTLVLQNIGAGVCTVTAGTATVSSAGPLAIPQYGSGTLYFTSAGAAIYFPSAVTAAAASSGLTLITNEAFSDTTFTLSGVFSATYENYLVNMSNVVSASSTPYLRFRLGAGTLHTFNLMYVTTGTPANESNGADGNFWNIGTLSTAASGYTSSINGTIMSPFLSIQSGFSWSHPGYSNQLQFGYGIETSATSFTDLVLSNSGGVSMSGSIQVYGYALS